MKPVNEERLQKVLEYIRDYEKDKGHSPTYREIKDEIGHKSLDMVYKDIRRLRERGMIREEANDRGGLVPDDKLASGEMVNVQVVGEIHCGEANDAIENITESYLLPVNLIGRGEHIMLRARGRSMTGRGIYPDDLLIIRPVECYEPRVNEVVAVSIGGEEACAKVIRRKEDGELYYCADSDETDDYGREFPDYEMDEGVVFGVIDYVFHDPTAY